MSYCEWPEFFIEQYPTARKEHICCECRQKILRGEKYGRFTGKWAGHISTYTQHLLCKDACVFIRDKFQGGECIGFGDLFEHCSDYTCSSRTAAEDPDVASFRSMIAKIRRRVRAQMLGVA